MVVAFRCGAGKIPTIYWTLTRRHLVPILDTWLLCCLKSRIYRIYTLIVYTPSHCPTLLDECISLLLKYPALLTHQYGMNNQSTFSITISCLVFFKKSNDLSILRKLIKGILDQSHFSTTWNSFAKSYVTHFILFFCSLAADQNWHALIFLFYMAFIHY